jgi:hypothetical protein
MSVQSFEWLRVAVLVYLDRFPHNLMAVLGNKAAERV